MTFIDGYIQYATGAAFEITNSGVSETPFETFTTNKYGDYTLTTQTSRST